MNVITHPRSRQAVPRILVVLGIVSSAFTISLWAQPTDQSGSGDWERGVAPMADDRRGPDGPPPGGHPLLALFDADQDGVISAAEIDHAAAALLSIDADGDGTVSKDELVAALPRPPGPPMGRRSGRGMGPPRGADF